ncbi:MAG: 1-acyl-sn-glycerol-3-phosphate acyltransferase [Bauldia sp.]
MIVVRSLLFQIAFYVVTAIMLIASAPIFIFGSQEAGMGVVRNWARVCTFLHAKIAGGALELRGVENLPKGAALVASKHQSAFETFALIPLLRNPTIVMKQSIRGYPIFGPYTVKTGMIHVDREGKTAALRALSDRAREEAAKEREIIIFPEGTRRPPDAPPDYQTGVALLYRTLNIPVVPVALNSGVVWPRNSFLHYPGKIVIEFLPAIPPGLDSRAFLTRLQDSIETASRRLVAEGRAARKAS